jgi:hypothetical protein
MSNIDHSEAGTSPLPLLSDLQAAKTLGCSPSFLRKARINGGGPDFVKVGSLVRYSPEALMRFIEAHTEVRNAD